MNKAIFMGRFTKDPELRHGSAGNIAIAWFSLAVNRAFKRDGQPDADFFDFTAFGKTAEFVSKYMHKGIKVVVESEAQNNNYTDKNGQKVYGVRFIVNSIEFAESKSSGRSGQNPDQGFVDIDDTIDDEGIPFA